MLVFIFTVLYFYIHSVVTGANILRNLLAVAPPPHTHTHSVIERKHREISNTAVSINRSLISYQHTPYHSGGFFLSFF